MSEYGSYLKNMNAKMMERSNGMIRGGELRGVKIGTIQVRKILRDKKCSPHDFKQDSKLLSIHQPMVLVKPNKPNETRA